MTHDDLHFVIVWCSICRANSIVLSVGASIHRLVDWLRPPRTQIYSYRDDMDKNRVFAQRLRQSVQTYLMSRGR